MVSHTELDKTLTFPIADFCTLNNRIVVSSYDSMLRVYSLDVLEASIPAPCVYTKLCECDSRLLGISYTTGILSVFDSNMNNLCNMSGFTQPTILMCFGQYVIIGTRNKEIVVLKENSEFLENQTSFFNIVQRIDKCKTPTSISSNQNYLAIAFENTLSLFNIHFDEIFTKSYSDCISAIEFFSETTLAIGFQNGKVQIECIKDPEESFLFNSHFLCSASQKILFPVTYIKTFGTKLFSSGYEGKVIKWDLEQKRMLSTVIDFKKFIRKFLVNENTLYTLVEDGNTNTLCYSDFISEL